MAYTYSPRTGRYEFIQPMFFASPRQKSRRMSQDPPPYPPPPTPSGGRTHPAQSPGQVSTKTSRRPPSTPGRGSNSNLEYYYPQGTPPGIVRPGAYMPPPSKKRASRLSTGTVVPPSTPQRQRRNSTVPTPGPNYASPGKSYRSEYAPPQDSRPRISATAGPSPGVKKPKKKVRFGPYDDLSRYPCE